MWNYRVPLRVPSCPPSREDWEYYRGMFTQLYQIEDRPLKAVKELMEQQHGFKATERMYKKKINKWRIMKNYSREEKSAVCRALERRLQTGKADHEVMIRDQPVKFHRILRHIKTVAKETGIQSSGGPSMFMDDYGVEVRTPDAGCFIDNESSLPKLQVDLLRRLSWTPGPGRPILPRDDLGKAELLCCESVGYFQTVLSSDPHPSQRLKRLEHRDPIRMVNCISLATCRANAGRYSDARLLLNKASEELKEALRDQSVKLLPALLGAVYYSCDEKTPFKVSDLFHKHATKLCEAVLGVRHPTTVVMRTFREVDNKAQVLNTILESLLSTVLMKVDFDEVDDLPIYLIHRKAGALEALGQYDEAERLLERALTSCTSVYGTRHVLTLRIMKRLAWLNFEGSQNYPRAKVLFEKLLRGSGYGGGKVTDPWVSKKALEGLAGVAKLDGDLRKAEHLLGEALGIALKVWGPRAEETVHMAGHLEATLRECGKHEEADRLGNSIRLEDSTSA